MKRQKQEQRLFRRLVRRQGRQFEQGMRAFHPMISSSFLVEYKESYRRACAVHQETSSFIRREFAARLERMGTLLLGLTAGVPAPSAVKTLYEEAEMERHRECLALDWLHRPVRVPCDAWYHPLLPHAPYPCQSHGLEQLPVELLHGILGWLHISEARRLVCVCRRWAHMIFGNARLYGMVLYYIS